MGLSLQERDAAVTEQVEVRPQLDSKLDELQRTKMAEAVLEGILGNVEHLRKIGVIRTTEPTLLEGEVNYLFNTYYDLCQEGRDKDDPEFRDTHRRVIQLMNFSGMMMPTVLADWSVNRIGEATQRLGYKDYSQAQEVSYLLKPGEVRRQLVHLHLGGGSGAFLQHLRDQDPSGYYAQISVVDKVHYSIEEVLYKYIREDSEYSQATIHRFVKLLSTALSRALKDRLATETSKSSNAYRDLELKTPYVDLNWIFELLANPELLIEQLEFSWDDTTFVPAGEFERENPQKTSRGVFELFLKYTGEFYSRASDGEGAHDTRGQMKQRALEMLRSQEADVGSRRDALVHLRKMIKRVRWTLVDRHGAQRTDTRIHSTDAKALRSILSTFDADKDWLPGELVTRFNRAVGDTRRRRPTEDEQVEAILHKELQQIAERQMLYALLEKVPVDEGWFEGEAAEAFADARALLQQEANGISGTGDLLVAKLDEIDTGIGKRTKHLQRRIEDFQERKRPHGLEKKRNKLRKRAGSLRRLYQQAEQGNKIEELWSALNKKAPRLRDEELVADDLIEQAKAVCSGLEARLEAMGPSTAEDDQEGVAALITQLIGKPQKPNISLGEIFKGDFVQAIERHAYYEDPVYGDEAVYPGTSQAVLDLNLEICAFPQGLIPGRFETIDELIPARSVDNATSIRADSHLISPEFEKYLTKVIRCLKPGGILEVDGLRESLTRVQRFEEVIKAMKEHEEEFRVQISLNPADEVIALHIERRQEEEARGTGTGFRTRDDFEDATFGPNLNLIDPKELKGHPLQVINDLRRRLLKLSGNRDDIFNNLHARLEAMFEREIVVRSLPAYLEKCGTPTNYGADTARPLAEIRKLITPSTAGQPTTSDSIAEGIPLIKDPEAQEIVFRVLDKLQMVKRVEEREGLREVTIRDSEIVEAIVAVRAEDDRKEAIGLMECEFVAEGVRQQVVDILQNSEDLDEALAEVTDPIEFRLVRQAINQLRRTVGARAMKDVKLKDIELTADDVLDANLLAMAMTTDREGRILGTAELKDISNGLAHFIDDWLEENKHQVQRHAAGSLEALDPDKIHTFPCRPAALKGATAPRGYNEAYVWDLDDIATNAEFEEGTMENVMQGDMLTLREKAEQLYNRWGRAPIMLVSYSDCVHNQILEEQLRQILDYDFDNLVEIVEVDFRSNDDEVVSPDLGRRIDDAGEKIRTFSRRGGLLMIGGSWFDTHAPVGKAFKERALYHFIDALNDGMPVRAIGMCAGAQFLADTAGKRLGMPVRTYQGMLDMGARTNRVPSKYRREHPLFEGMPELMTMWENHSSHIADGRDAEARLASTGDFNALSYSQITGKPIVFEGWREPEDDMGRLFMFQSHLEVDPTNMQHMELILGQLESEYAEGIEEAFGIERERLRGCFLRGRERVQAHAGKFVLARALRCQMERLADEVLTTKPRVKD